MVFIDIKLVGEIKECFTGGVDVELVINNPAGGRAVFNCVPDITVAGDDLVALCLQLFCCCKESIPAVGAGTDLLCYDCGIISAPDILSDGTMVNESTAGGLIAKANELAVGGTGADVDGVGCDAGLCGLACNVDAEVFISCCILAGIALSILEDEGSLAA